MIGLLGSIKHSPRNTCRIFGVVSMIRQRAPGMCAFAVITGFIMQQIGRPLLASKDIETDEFCPVTYK